MIALCEREGVKPTPLIRSLGFSAGNIKRWENGATVNSDILLAVSEHFKVSVDYLLTGEDHVLTIPQNNGIQQTDGRECELLKYFRCLPTDEKDKLIGRAQLLAEQASIEENAG